MASKSQPRTVLTLKRKLDLLKDIERKQDTQTEIAKKYTGPKKLSNKFQMNGTHRKLQSFTVDLHGC